MTADEHRPTETGLWCLYVYGPDDVHAAPSKEAAERAARHEQRTINPSDGPPPLRLPDDLLATAEGKKIRDLGYLAIISIPGGVKTFTRAEVFELRDWLTALLDYRYE